MRTTVTLDPDSEALVKRMMRDRGLGFKEAINAAIRAGATTTPADRRFSTPTFAMGADPQIDLHRALRLAGELEDDEISREIATRK
jgi:hypothetical protein